MDPHNHEENPPNVKSSQPPLTGSDIPDNKNTDDDKVILQKEKKWYTGIVTDWRQHKYDMLGLFVGTLNIVMTGIFIVIAVLQNKKADTSNTIARETLQFAKDQSVDQGKEARRRFVMDSLSAQSQIDALKSQVEIMQKQYKAEIMPLIRCSPKKFEMAISKKIVPVKIEIMNIGRYPIRMLWSNVSIFVTTDNYIPKANDEVLDKPIQLYRTTVSLFRTIEINPTIDLPFSTLLSQEVTQEEFWNDVKVGRAQIYLLGRVGYENLIDGSKWQYRFCHRIHDPLNFNQAYEQFEDDCYPLLK